MLLLPVSSFPHALEMVDHSVANIYIRPWEMHEQSRQSVVPASFHHRLYMITIIKKITIITRELFCMIEPRLGLAAGKARPS